jgi:anhydro-N-acetylmuramic acid kinase
MADPTAATRLIAGAMSGTSADGVDVAITRIDGTGLDMRPQLIRHHCRPYDADLRQAIFALRASGQTTLTDLAKLGRDISLAYAAAVNQALAAANLKPTEIAAVAAHGQTLYHAPPNTIQWLDPALIAAETGCAVVSDFRRADCAAGGQGAPLVPFADYICFRDPNIHRAVVNIGGIANVTCLPAGVPLDRVIAFDTGPGNCISDFLMRQHDPTGPGIDVDGWRTAKGKVNPSLFEAARSQPYFEKFGPKSTDGPAMIAGFQDALAAVTGVSVEDQLATACQLTVFQIMRIVTTFGGTFDVELIVSGGGIRNRTMMQMLHEWAGDIPILTTDSLGVPSDAKEALAFALLAAATLDNVPSNVPSCTGAACRVVLGSITPRP